MVRLKNRYLLVEILYPEPSSWPLRATTPTAPKPSQQSPSQSESESHLQIHSPTSNALTPGLLAKMVRDQVADIYGDWGAGRLGGSGVSVKYLSPATSTTILRCPRSSYRLVWTALTYMNRVPDLEGDFKYPDVHSQGRDCVFRVIRVSGTMRKAEEEAVRRARKEIVRLRGAEEVDVLEGIVGGGFSRKEGPLGGDGDMDAMDEDEEDSDD